MGVSVLPVSNIINVSITNTPSGLSEKNVNSLAILTNEQPNNFDPFGIYLSASQVAADYGSNSVTTKMAQAVFGQSPNILTGKGRLVVVPMLNAVSATQGQFVTPSISANLAGFIAVNNGDVKVTVDGTAHDLLAMNFTKCLTLADVAAVIQAKLIDCTVTNVTNTLVFQSKRGGTTSTVALAAATGGTGTALNGAGYLNSSTGTATPGVNSSGESVLAAVARVEGQVSFVGFMTNLTLEDAAFATIAVAVQAQDRIFLHHFADYKAIAGVATTNQQAGNKKARPLLYTDSLAAANLEKAAYTGRGFSVNFTGSNTSQTMNLKQLVGITPDSNITQTMYAAAEVAGIDCYVSYDGVPSVFSTGGNDFFDNPYSDLALKFALETAGFNFLRQTNTKVPQTETGMNGLKAAYSAVCDRFVRNGCVAPGSWNSSETFGDPEIFRENILNNGYYIYSLPIIQQDPAEREARKAPLVQIAIKRAGAIHTSDVIVIIND